MPSAIRDLPLDLLRSHMVTKDPAVIERGIAQYAGRQDVFFSAPSEAQFQKYKSQAPPVAWGQNVVSMLAAVRFGLQKQAELRRQVARVPVMDFVQAGQSHGAARIPEPTDSLSERLTRTYAPLTRNLPPLDSVVDEARLQRYVDSSLGDRVGNDARLAAMASVAAQKQALEELLWRPG